MEITINQETGLRELVLMAVLNSIGSEVRLTNPTERNPEGAEFRWCECEVTYPNGDKKLVDSILWNKSFEKFPDAFAVGKEICLTTQLEGEGAGFSKIGLPVMRRVDISKFNLDEIKVADDYDIIEDNVIESEQVL